MIEKVKIHNCILPEAKLPFSKIKGSVASRNRLAAEYNTRFCREINKYCKNGVCELEKYKEVLDKVLYPDKIHYMIKNETTDKFSGGLNSTINITRANTDGGIKINHTGYEIKVRYINGKALADKYTLIHETSHLFDRLINPKYTLYRFQSIINNPKEEALHNEINDMFLVNLNEPVKMEILKQKTNKILENLSSETAIDTLQRLRYKLLSEINAYKNEFRAVFRDNPINSVSMLIHLCRNFKFKSKLKYVNNALKNRLSTEREVNYSKTD